MTISLTCEQDTDNPLAINALEIIHSSDISSTGGRECVIDCAEAIAFRNDCTGWNHERYSDGYSIEVTISASDWEKWCAGYEIVEAHSADSAASVEVW